MSRFWVRKGLRTTFNAACSELGTSLGGKIVAGGAKWHSMLEVWQSNHRVSIASSLEALCRPREVKKQEKYCVASHFCAWIVNAETRMHGCVRQLCKGVSESGPDLACSQQSTVPQFVAADIGGIPVGGGNMTG